VSAPAAPELLDMILEDLNATDSAAPRSQQARSGRLGPSDIGFCRQKAVLVTNQTPPTNTPPKYSAMWGTAIHNYTEAVLKQRHPTWLMGSIDNTYVTATLPSGAKIGGHPDIVIPEWNMLLDIKTVDGFEWVRRNGTSDSHLYQRWLYVKGCIEAGILDASKTIYVGNLYFDRAGKESGYLNLDEWNLDLEGEIDAWITDVTYAVENGEDASRDIPASVCAQICEFFTVCRGNLPVHEGQEFTDSVEIKSAIRMINDSKAMAAEAKRLARSARPYLIGFNGTDGEFQVRWVEIPSTFIEGHEREGYDRLDVVPLKSS